MRQFPNWPTTLAFVVAGGLALYFDLGNFGFVAAIGIAFCVALVTEPGIDRGIVKPLLAIAALFFAAALFNASLYNVGFGDLLLLNSEVRAVRSSMTAVYVCLIGAGFVEIAHRF